MATLFIVIILTVDSVITLLLILSALFMAFCRIQKLAIWLLLSSAKYSVLLNREKRID